MAASDVPHVLVKWTGDEKWDVYPVTAIADPSLGLRLLTEQDAIKDLRGSIIDVRWKAGEQAAPAKLLELGKPRALGKKRDKIAAAHLERIGSSETDKENGCCDCQGKVEQFEGDVRRLTAENEELRKRLEGAEKAAEPGRMVKKLKRVIEECQKTNEEPQVLQAAKIDIGNGVHLDKGLLERLDRTCGHTSPGKFSRALLRQVFTNEELSGKSLFGIKNNIQKTERKEALDPVRVNAVIGYTCLKYPGASIVHIKNSLASLLAREIK